MVENSKSAIPGFVTTKQAATMLGVSNHRMYQYVKAGHLPVIRVGKAFMLRVEDVERFKPHPSGRVRTRASYWRIYRSRGVLLVTAIDVEVRPHQQEPLLEKLREIERADRHTFPGTLARYVIKGDALLTTVHILLIWKDTEMPDEVVRAQDLAAFQEELADVLDWEHAHYSTNEAIIHT
jgi:excisionase family DNA binding protein